jgi:hypothetical protein
MLNKLLNFFDLSNFNENILTQKNLYNVQYRNIEIVTNFLNKINSNQYWYLLN